MKFLVDELPYYGGYCTFLRHGMCWVGESHTWDCPIHWDKEFVCSPENPHECEMLREVDNDG